MKNIKDYMDGKFTDPTKPEYYGTVAGSDGKWNNYGGAFANTDWFSEFYRDWVPSTEHNLSLSGGTDKLTYMLRLRLISVAEVRSVRDRAEVRWYWLMALKGI